MIIAKLLEFEFTKTVKNLLPNKVKVIEFLKHQKWTLADMDNHEWLSSRYDEHFYSKNNTRCLNNSNGVKISPMHNKVIIGYFQ